MTGPQKGTSEGQLLASIHGVDGPERDGLKQPVLSVVGLGKLGACTAACFAYRGFRTIGMDVNTEFVAAMNDGKAPIYEPRLDELLATAGDRLTATTDYGQVIEESDATFLIVPTPSQANGRFSEKYLAEALTELAQVLRRSEKPYHLFVVTSTVSPGTTDQRLIPLIENVSGRRLGDGFGICYNPEFIALGSVIRDFLRPDLVLIGQSDTVAGDIVESIHRAVCENSPQVHRMSLVSAEIAKLSLNAYATMKISFANTLAEVCAAILGADVDAITRALGADRRVSPHGLRGGMPYGGPCFPRDNRAFAAFAAEHGVDARLAVATDEVNRHHEQDLIDLVLAHLPPDDDLVAILGLAYKPLTPVIEESSAIALLHTLVGRGTRVRIYDPLAEPAVRASVGDRVEYAGSVREAMAGSAVTVITMPSEEFAEIDDSYVTHNPATIIDCWRILDPSKFPQGIRYVAMGAARGGTP